MAGSTSAGAIAGVDGGGSIVEDRRGAGGGDQRPADRPPRRLLLDGLPAAVRGLTVFALIAWGLVALFVVAFGLSIEVAGGRFAVPDIPPVPKALPPVVSLALAAVVAAISAASLSPGWRLGWPTWAALAKSASRSRDPSSSSPT